MNIYINLFFFCHYSFCTVESFTHKALFLFKTALKQVAAVRTVRWFLTPDGLKKSCSA